MTTPRLVITLADINAQRYIPCMIASFARKETEGIFGRRSSRKLPQTIQRTAMKKLWQLDAAVRLDELRVPPGNHLESLSGDREGQHSIRVNDQFRLCFRWQQGNAYDVEIVDYHKG